MFGFWNLYLKQKLKLSKNVHHDTNLQTHLIKIKICEKYDSYNYEKFNKHLRGFFTYYLKSFDFYSNEDTFYKMRKQKSNVMKYLYRIPHRLHNDLKMSQMLYNSIYNVNEILEGYLHQVSEKYNIVHHVAPDILHAYPENY